MLRLTLARSLLVALTIVLASCTSIPLSTMLEFRTFGEEEFLSLQPEHIEAQIQIEEPARLEVEKTQLAVILTSKHHVQSYQFPLVLVSEQPIASEKGLWSQKPAKTQYSFQLSDAARESFRGVQADVQRDDSLGFEFTVNFSMETLPKPIDEIRLSLFLKLYEDGAFTPIFRDAKLKIDRAE